jgi:hypothetical protein
VRVVEGAVTEGGVGAVPSGGGGGLRPLALGETLDRAIKLYRSDAITLWKLVSVIIIPLEVIDVVVRRLSLPSDVVLLHGNFYSVTGQSSSQTVAVLLSALLLLVGNLVATGATFRSLIDAYLGNPTDWRTSLDHARTRFGSLLWLSILTAVLAVIGFILLIIPGVWFIVSVSVAIPVLMLEGTSGFAAMKRSIDLVDTRWWATFGRLLAAYVLLGVVLFGVGALAAAVFRSMTNVTLFVVLSGVISALGRILVSPFVAAVITVIYVDLRVRKEAFDIELLAGSLGGTPTVVPVAPASPFGGVPAASPFGEAPPSSGLGGTTQSQPPPSQPPPSEPTWPPAG